MASEASSSGDGSLERLGIAVSTNAPEDLLTPNAVRAVRFHKSKPWGLLEEDVKDFQEITISALSWYLDQLHKRDMDVYTLGKELDTRETQIANLNLQLASAQYNSGVKDAIDRNEEDKEMADLLSRVAELEADLSAARAELTASQQALAAAQAAAVEAPVQEQAPVSPANTEELEQLRSELVAAQRQVATLTAANQQLEEFADQQEKYIDSLLTQFETDAADQQDDADTNADDEPYLGTETDEPADDPEPYAPAQLTTPVENDMIAPVEEESYVQDDAFGTDEDEVYEADQIGDDDEDTYDEAESYDAEDYEVEAPAVPTVEAYAPEVPTAPAAAPTQQPTQTENSDSNFVYKGMKLPPGIRPEDL